MSTTQMMCCAVRFKPGQELKSTLLQHVESMNLKAAFVLTCVGSVTKATLRMADSQTVKCGFIIS